MNEGSTISHELFNRKVVLPIVSLIGFGLLGIPIGFFLLWLAVFKLTLTYILLPFIFKFAYIALVGVVWWHFWRPELKAYSQSQRLAGMVWLLLFLVVVGGLFAAGYKVDPGGRHMMNWIASWAAPLDRAFS